MTKEIKNKVCNPDDNNIITKLFKDYEFKMKKIQENKKKSLIISVIAPKDAKQY